MLAAICYGAPHALGVAGMSISTTSGANASTTAFMIAPGAPMVPASPRPWHPADCRAERGVGVELERKEMVCTRHGRRVEEKRASRLDRRLRRYRRRQRLVADIDKLGRVLRLLARLGDDHCHWSPTWRTLPWASNGCGGSIIGLPSFEVTSQPQERPPTCRPAPVKTAATPGAALAAAALMVPGSARAWGLRNRKA